MTEQAHAAWATALVMVVLIVSVSGCTALCVRSTNAAGQTSEAKQ